MKKWQLLKKWVTQYSNNVSDEVAQDAYKTVLEDMEKLEYFPGFTDDLHRDKIKVILLEAATQQIKDLQHENMRLSDLLMRITLSDK